MTKRLIATLMLAAVGVVGVHGAGVAAGLSGEDPEVLAADETDAPTTEPPATEPPATDAPPGTGETGDDEGESDITGFLIIGAIVLLLLILFGMIVRGGRQRPVVVQSQAPAPPAGPPPATVDWVRRARSAYATTRWIHDTADDDLATWKQAELTNPASVTPSDPRFQSWRDVEHELASVTSQLYALEADAPSGVARTAVRSTGAALRGLSAALDNRIKLASDADPQTVNDAATALSTERGRVSRALDDLSDAIRGAS